MKISERSHIKKDRFCCLVSRHDIGGIRGMIADIVSKSGDIDYGGKFRHNTDALYTIYKDNKIEFLKRYRFNICPENSDCQGYVTEKLFDSFEAGCIPIYWGSGNDPEPDLIDKDAILFWNDSLEYKLKELEDADAYEEFISRPVFKENAGEIIWNYFENLENAIRQRL